MAQVKEVKGPGPRRMGGPKPKVENPGKLLKRIMEDKKQREEWESQYAAAHELWEEHKEFVAKELENAAESAAADGQGPKEEKPVEETSNYSSAAPATGTLADSDQLAALRDQLLGK